MISAVDIGLVCDGKTILEDINLSISPGETYGIVGSNGAGKSSLFSILTTVQNPTGGMASVAGLDATKNKYRIKTKIGYAPEDSYIPGYMTPRQYLRFISGIRKMNADVAVERCEKLIGQFDLRHVANTLQVKLSKGERKKVVIAASIIHEPEYVFLDEPTEALDPESVEKLKNFIRSMQNGQRLIMLATHRLSFAEDLCERVGIMSKGALVEEVTVGELEFSLKELYLDKVEPQEVEAEHG